MNPPRAKIDNAQQNLFCVDKDETINNIVNKYSKLAQKE